MAVVEEDLAQLAHLLDLSHPEHGPIDINNERYVDMHGMPALWFAISHISAGVARVLLQAGASVARAAQTSAAFSASLCDSFRS